ncbi:TadE family protein [Roseisolibacter sp. H3M3-2]|uniref:TadE/TadG family type IV pilus assembly protein n=1 Tax=Roseisolibacter sp. H3M3-2 TaxID=3031323 RepID=UPI0023D9A0A1|nr:TadE family protein [Roseisolibacter sp. H3M3-2]MDF1502324.1 pilus assembly protein [Roseisolibacter sp. H3M3-2]
MTALVHGLRRRLRDDTGATAVEFAILVPALMLLILGIIEFGYASFRRSTATEGARYGVRLAMVRGTEAKAFASSVDTTAAFIQTQVRARVGDPNLVVTVSHPDGNATAPSRVRVSATYTGTTRITGLFPAMAIGATAESVITY